MREWRLNNHRLLCADSTDRQTVIDFIGKDKVQTIFTDPPYKMTYSGSGCFKSATQRVADRIKGMIDFNAEKISFYADLGINSIYIFCSKELLGDYINIFKGWNFTPLVWCKTNPVPFCASSYLPDIEYLLYFSRKGRIWNNGLKPLAMYSRFYVSSKEEGKHEAGDVHPTVKPLKLAASKIEISTTPGGIVFDGFGGSGTTLIAAELTGRICYMIEQDEKYCSEIVKRWERMTGMKAYEC